jgi:hypothetical protein
MGSSQRGSRSEPSVHLEALPSSILPDEHRRLLERMVEQSDQLLFLDKTCELAADRDALIRMVSDESLIPADLGYIEVLETAKHLGRRLKGFDGGRRLTWAEGEKYGLPVSPPSADELRAAGISEGTSPEELAELLKKKFPDLPASLTEAEPRELQELARKNLAVNRTVWDCLVANLGFWAALTWIGSSVIFLSFLTLGWQIALAIAIAYSGFATAYVILQCLVNQEFHF